MNRHYGAYANEAGESTSKTARSDSKSVDPFYLSHCDSDVTLVVEDKKLHVHKAVLSVHSPVFSAMFTADFAEKDAKEIPLHGKKYDAMLQFLLMMYPVHSVKAIRGMYGAFYLRTQTKLSCNISNKHTFFFFLNPPTPTPINFASAKRRDPVLQGYCPSQSKTSCTSV